ncbi:GNAT family N-acetyltransferase [Streptomyces sp. NPDC017940]|uniref:GNAT family N-acetyltransferase n=1 Tax=Streptomyces sp. NPDC017940 TaxID=3365017 RepID=UPI0037B14141
MILEPLPAATNGTAPTPGDLPGPLLTELTALYASHHEFFTLSGDFPDAHDIRAEQVATALADELAQPGAEVLLGRSEGRLVGVVVTLARHPDPAEPDLADPDPWIGLLLVDAQVHRPGLGKELAAAIEQRFRAAGHAGVRLAVRDNNPKGLAFWTALGYELVDHREDTQLGRPCAVLRKPL